MLPCFTLLFIRYMITDIFAVNMFIQCAFTLHSNTKQSSISDENLWRSYCHLVFQIFTAQSALTPPKCSQDFQSRAIRGDRWHLAPCASLHILCTCVSFKWCEPSKQKIKNKKSHFAKSHTKDVKWSHTGKFLLIPIPQKVSHHAEHWLGNSSWWDHRARILTAKSL